MEKEAISALKFDGQGLIPAVVQDWRDGTVLMVRLEDGAEILVRRNGGGWPRQRSHSTWRWRITRSRR